MLIAHLSVTTVAALAGIVLLLLMLIRDETLMGVWALVALCLAGVTASFYGAMSSMPG